MKNNIRPALPQEHEQLLTIWLGSVKATHHFLTDDDIEKLYCGLKNEWLKAVSLWVIEHQDKIVGFIGLDENKVEMLFIDATHQRMGLGSQLIDFVKQNYKRVLLDVNEQNPQALKFYQQQGFVITGRSELDGQGNPFPLLHLQFLS